MKRFTKTFNLNNHLLIKSQLLQWSQPNPIISWMDSNNYADQFSNYDAILAIGAANAILTKTEKNAFNLLNNFQKKHQDYLFGFLTYDLKNDLENLSSSNYDGLNFPSLYFFQPKKIIFLKDDSLIFSYLNDEIADLEIDFNEIINQKIIEINEHSTIITKNIQQRISKQNYLEKSKDILNHLKKGNIYEINFCLEFYLENTAINPFQIFDNLNKISSAPFTSFFRLNEHYVCCASPERYIKKYGNKIISQPIKGTSKRGKTLEQDLILINNLENNPKERAENIMIVDLVRNDLSKSAIKGSVKVEELCKTYTFKQVHQLISTISAEISSETSPITLIQNTFPMGSMTGAPKISAMKIIEDMEETKRGLYSGSIGYFTPEGDFDFNVIIRSILHNTSTKYTSFSVGSAFTALSNPAQEYEECLLKARAMQMVLTDS